MLRFLLVAVLYISLGAYVKGATWPLSKYTSCGTVNIRDSLGQYGFEDLTIDAGGLSLLSDEDVLWLAAAGKVVKTEWSTGRVLGAYEVGSASSGT